VVADWRESRDGEGMKRSMAEQTWAGALREVGRAALRHKVATGIVAICVAGSLIAIGLVGAAAGQTARPAPVAAPAFRLPALGHDGQQVSLSSYRGRPLVVNFFASWCAPCQKETPLLARFYGTQKGKVALVGLDENDTIGKATSFTRAEGVGYPVGWDPGGSAATSYGVAALPQTFFLNARHQIVHRVFGAVTLADLHQGIELATAG
jgi:cytochrome c biogenesis protein CcmG/thiol:disulfide interchange protein DsbE